MNRDETKKIVMVMNASYPNMKWNQEQITGLVDAWELMLADYTYTDVSVGLKAYITTNTSGFPPSVGQVIEQIHKIKNRIEGSEHSDMEYWGMVRKAISNGAYGYKEEYEKLPELAKKAVGSAEQIRAWAVDMEFNEGVAQSQFLRTLRTEKERDDLFKRMPSEIQALTNKTVERLSDDRSYITIPCITADGKWDATAQ